MAPSGPDDAEALTQLVRLAYGKYIGRIGALPGPIREDYRRVTAARVVWLVEQESNLDAIADVAQHYNMLRFPAMQLLRMTPVVALSFLNDFKVPWFQDGFRWTDPIEMR